MKRNTVLADFFLDGAKILFGPLVVGAFAPGSRDGGPSWLTAEIGVLWIATFLVIAVIARKRE